MRVVLDTNVVASGVFFGGTPGRVLTAWTTGQFALVLSPAILDEYRRVGQDLGRRHPALSATFEPLLTLIALNATIVMPLHCPIRSARTPTTICSWRRPSQHTLQSSSPAIATCSTFRVGTTSSCYRLASSSTSICARDS